jgi:hypothetical protein
LLALQVLEGSKARINVSFGVNVVSFVMVPILFFGVDPRRFNPSKPELSSAVVTDSVDPLIRNVDVFNDGARFRPRQGDTGIVTGRFGTFGTPICPACPFIPVDGRGRALNMQVDGAALALSAVVISFNSFERLNDFLETIFDSFPAGFVVLLFLP